MASTERETLRKTAWEGTDSAKRVLAERYLLRRDGKVVETPEELFWRVSRSIAGIEKTWGRTPEAIEEVADAFYQLMATNRFMPNSPTLMNAGKDNGLQYSACYVLPVDDSIGGIFDSVKNAAVIHQSGGGTGFSFSRLRQKDSVVKSTGGRASGPVSFLRVFNAATEAVKQGGTRRGANMGILRVDHPDILEFIHSKRDLDENHTAIYKSVEAYLPEEAKATVFNALRDRQIANFNISVTVTEPFMKALASDGEYELIAPHTKDVVKRLRAREVFDVIVRCAWETGDPGLVFLDRVNSSPANPTPEVNIVEATNPCGEQPLYPNEACNLGSINMAKFVVGEGTSASVHWEALRENVHLCIRFLDDVIEANPYPLPEIDRCVKENRRVGLGVMGWADLLMMLRIPYDSTEAVDLGTKVMKFINEAAHEASRTLAKERGAFPNCDRSIYKDAPQRNSTVTTIAPTGTISIIAGCSSGIEPIFALAFQHVVGERRLTFVNPVLEAVAKGQPWYTDAVKEEILKLGMLRDVKGIPEDVRQAFVTAHEVTPEWHIKHQGAYQRHTDNGVSKTINLPHDATEEDIRKAYLLAYEVGCMGITVYRDGCKGVQVLNVGVKKDDKAKAHAVAPAAPAAPAANSKLKPRPNKVRGTTSVIRTPVGSAFVTINEDDRGEPLEVFVTVGKSGSDIIADAEAIGRLISFALRAEAPQPARERLLKIAMQLEGIGGSRSTGFGQERVRSLADGVARVIFDYLGEGSGRGLPAGGAVESKSTGTHRDLCHSCGNATLALEEGCKKCHSCGYSEC